MLPGRRGMCKEARVTAILLALVSLGDACGFAHREFMGATTPPMGFTQVWIAFVLAGWAEHSLVLQSPWRTGNL